MIKIQNVNDAAYKRFGKVITDIELGDLLQAMEATPCPDDVVYVASEAALEATKSAEKFQEIYYESFQFRQDTAMATIPY